ncbi:16224_t:CDS:2, partial [Funneliformis geosporum]
LYGKPEKLEEHLANECLKVLDIIQSYYVNIVAFHGFDCSREYHTSEYLALQISEVVEQVGKDKIVAVVTDNASNCANAYLFDLDQFPLYLRNDNEFENEDELSEINESDENNSDLNK